jgi:uncharacterized protein
LDRRTAGLPYIAARMNKHPLRLAFRSKQVVLPVIHVESLDQALRNLEIAQNAGADGAFLINHEISSRDLLGIHTSAHERFSDFWMGVNCLDLAPEDVFQAASNDVRGVWADNAMIDEDAFEQPEATRVLTARRSRGSNSLYFGGVAFKYQRQVSDLSRAATLSRDYMDVVTTSGPGTGQPAHIEKIRVMKEALGEFPLAIASGITPDNVGHYLPHADCFLVATGISKSFEELDAELARRLIDAVREFQ